MATEVEEKPQPKKYERKVYASGSAFLAPLTCGSTIAYRVTRSGGTSDYFDAQIELTDCNRKISWEFDTRPEMVEKIDNAIAMLTEFRKEFVKARRDYLKDHPKKNSNDDDY